MTTMSLQGAGKNRCQCTLADGTIAYGSTPRKAYEKALLKSAKAEIVIVNASQIYEDLTVGIIWTEDDIYAVAETLEVEAKNGAPCPVIMNSDIAKRVLHDIDFLCPANLKGVETIILNVYADYVSERGL